MLFSNRSVDSNLIAWNRVVLLHGPPGTGKTSLCEGLPQKLAIRLSQRNPNVVILTTSNVTEKIDLAFVDRADIKQNIGPPSPSVIFKIYLSCLNELMKTTAADTESCRCLPSWRAKYQRSVSSSVELHTQLWTNGNGGLMEIMDNLRFKGPNSYTGKVS
ncbi:pachytene checkpoint protein 2 homolog isoform X2 [Polyodon spathula]|uniref:pachytene checkpoint protein 2 homolog isoform X2 n=1 Tax=Polyodon spathula TaxID=7913 RepID=UPI001B7E59BE|nr:pachytene checkpoint protein 2 homolog isoform X2 [Polyodon spathula]